MLGLGSIWAQGLSGSAALQMATPGALQPQIRDIVAHGGLVAGGLIPFRHTIFLWQSFVAVAVEIVVVVGVMYFATPPAGRGQDRAAISGSISAERQNCRTSNARTSLTPGQCLEHSPILTWFVVALGVTLSGALFLRRRPSR